MSVCQYKLGVPCWGTEINCVQLVAAVTFVPPEKSGRNGSLPPASELLRKLDDDGAVRLEEERIFLSSRKACERNDRQQWSCACGRKGLSPCKESCGKSKMANGKVVSMGGDAQNTESGTCK